MDKVGCVWRVVGCNLLSPVHAVFLTQSAFLMNAEVDLSLSDMKKLKPSQIGYGEKNVI